MRSLYAKITACFFIILLLLTSLTLWLTHRGTQAYFDEFTQRLNSSIAMYITRNAGLVENGELNTTALTELAPHVMMVNPSLEVYLLSNKGKVIAHSLAGQELIKQSVAIEPVRSFLREQKTLPIYGDNPKSRHAQSVFSVHPVVSDGATIAYVYAVLGSEQHQSLLASLRSSYSLKTLSITLACASAFALLAGSFVFFMLTGRLRSLTGRVKNRAARLDPSQTDTLTNHKAANTAARDEIEELEQAYSSLTHQLQRQYQSLAAVDRERRDLFANVSHDLRTPLTTLQGYLETILLKEPALAARDRRHFLEIALRQSQRLGKLISQLFNLSKMASGEFKLQSEKFSLLELAHDTAQDFRILAAEASIQIEVIPDEVADSSLDVEADIALVHRVFENLLDNAIRYTPRNGKIEMRLKRVLDQHVTVEVSDSGLGMTPEAVENIFKRHYAAGSACYPDQWFDNQPDGLPSRTTKGERTGKPSTEHAGLGLAIVRSIIELHECSIRVRSWPGEGTTFEFSLPAAGQLSTLSVEDSLPISEPLRSAQRAVASGVTWRD